MRKWLDDKMPKDVIKVGDKIKIDVSMDTQNPADLQHIIRNGEVTQVYPSFFTVRFRRPDGSYRIETFRKSDIASGYIKVLKNG